MKKLILGTLLSGILFGNLPAQVNRNNEIRDERIESFKIAFITKQLQLTPEESQQFWPLYNQFEKDKEALRDSYHMKDRKIELMSDAELEEFINKHFELEEKQFNLKKEFFRQIQQVLPIRKVAMLNKAELQFKRKLLEEMRRRKQQNRQRQGGRNFDNN